MMKRVKVRCAEVGRHDVLDANQRECVSSKRVRGQTALHSRPTAILNFNVGMGRGARQETCQCDFQWDVTFVFVGGGLHLPQLLSCLKNTFFLLF